jgi:hypothetical protein
MRGVMIDFITALRAMMTKKTRPTFSPEFRLETALLVVNQSYTHQEAAKAMGVGYSTAQKHLLKPDHQARSYMDTHDNFAKLKKTSMLIT